MNHSLERSISVRSLLQFTFPSIVMMVVMSLYSVVDGMFVARLLDTNAFSAVNIVYPILSLIIALGTMFGTGITAIVSRKLGEGKRREACENVTFILAFSAVLGVVLAGVALFFLDDIIPLLGANEAVFDYCRAYLLPLILFVPAGLLQIEFQSLFVANGKPGAGLAVTVLGGVANIVLDYVFIRFCGWGIAGAAIATGIGYCIPALYGLLTFGIHRDAPLHLVRPKADWRVLLGTMSNGSSEMVSNVSASVTTFLFNIIMMRHLGPDGVAAISVIMYLDFVLIAIALGYSIGAAPLFGYNYGCGNVGRQRELYRLSVWLCAVTGVVLSITTIVLAKPLAGIFAHPGTAVYELSVTGLRIAAIGYLYKGFNVFSSAVFTAYSDGRVSAILSFMRTLVFLCGTLLGLTALFGVRGVWYATPLAELLALALCITYTVRYRKKYHFGLKRQALPAKVEQGLQANKEPLSEE